MDRWQRVMSALRGDPVDRVPISLWRHFHVQDRTAGGLAAATLAFHRLYDLDLIKVTPSGLYGVEDWGADITYFDDESRAPVVRVPAVKSPGDWDRLHPLDPRQGALGRELRALELIEAGLQGEAPYLVTVFSPLTTAYKLAGDAVIRHLRQSPAALRRGLQVITDVTVHFSRLALEAGASGLFFATQLAAGGFLSREEHAEFGVPYDRAVLAAVSPKISVLHIHGEGIYFQDLASYPVGAISWHDRRTEPSLGKALSLTEKAFAAGLDRITLAEGAPLDVRREAREAISQTLGRRLILAPSCVVPPGAPPENLRSARQAVELLDRREGSRGSQPA